MESVFHSFARLVVFTGGLALLVVYALFPVFLVYLIGSVCIKRYKKYRRRQWAKSILADPVLSKNELYRSIAEDALIY